MDENSVNKYKIFNLALKKLIKELIVTFPDNKEFKIFLVIYKLLKTINKETPHKYFKEFILSKYRDYLLNEDDSFLHQEIVNPDKVPISVLLVLNELQEFNNNWEKIDQENKKIIWSHVRMLIELSDLCDKE